ncbi:group I truncated hemoglobin [Kordiimonas aestuarii]|uniref:group I truncated hemoglobin n=1 Tax=Kordiimonas aestuarii TaxID=1005925 RepID=UPI0021D1E87A|nr:group 1 truncated hemoglobin [Kordiimonas aestuarii]
MSIFEKIGGEPAVNEAVTLFHAKIFADPLLSPFFDNISEDDFNRKQRWFLITLLKGESVGADSYMRMSHRDLVRKHGLGEAHFDAVSAHLESSLVELDVARPLVNDIMSAVLELKNAILNR